ncbi:B3/B4 domain-containing protein [Enterococcus sp. LJL99]
MSIQLSNELQGKANLIITEVTLSNSKYDTTLWDDSLEPLMNEIKETQTLETLRANKRIKETKVFYKSIGLDASRYRPSSDSLLRRVIKGNGLYQINTLVDLNNYLSMKFQLPVGSYDLEQLGDSVVYRVGQANESYQGIGKGLIIIENFPVLSDEQGPFGSPISDSQRAMISEKTTHALVIVYCFGQSFSEMQQISKETKQVIQNIFPEVVFGEQYTI